MKGTLFQKPLEFNVLVEGETWRQGDPIKGVLTVKNHGAEAHSLGEILVALGHGKLRDIRAKAPDAFELLSTAKMEPSARVEPQKHVEFAWSFSTDRNAPITDVSSSLFVVYGRGPATEKMGQLQVTMQPYWVIEEILKVFQIGFRFVLKSQKARKDGVELKLAPPASQSFATLEALVLTFRFDGENLEVDYQFNLKKVEASAAAFDIAKLKRGIKQTFAPAQFLIPSGRFNHEFIESAVREALSTVEKKIVFT